MSRIANYLSSGALALSTLFMAGCATNQSPKETPSPASGSPGVTVEDLRRQLEEAGFKRVPNAIGCLEWVDPNGKKIGGVNVPECELKR